MLAGGGGAITSVRRVAGRLDVERQEMGILEGFAKDDKVVDIWLV